MSKLLEGRSIAVLAEQQYEDLELWYPVLRFREEGAKVSIAGTESKSYAGKHGYPLIVDKQISKLAAEDFDAVVIPGLSNEFGFFLPHPKRLGRAATRSFISSCCGRTNAVYHPKTIP